MKTHSDTLVLAWGNPARLDDGLGPALAEALAESAPPRTDIEADYQLQIERCEQVARYRRVVFVDADRSGPAPFWVRRLEPTEGSLSFSTHSVSPATVLALTRDLFEADPEAWLVGVRGYEFDDFGEALSVSALANLRAAVDYLSSACTTGRFEEIEPGPGTSNPQLREGEPCMTTNT